MSATVIDFPSVPRRICALCERAATRYIELTDENGRDIGKKFLCGEYPYCQPGETDDE